MTLTAREAMQALLDGKGVISDQDHLYWLTEQDRLVFRRVHGFVESDSSELNDIVSLYGESSDYSLTFEEALKAMLDGRVVESQRCNNPTRFHDGRFEYLCDDIWFFTDIQKFEQESKWKVVE